MNAPLHDYNSARCKLSNQCILFHPCWKVLFVILALSALTLPFSNTWIDFHLISHLVISYIHSHDLSVLDQHCQRHNGPMDGLTLALRSRLLQTLTSTIQIRHTFATLLCILLFPLNKLSCKGRWCWRSGAWWWCWKDVLFFENSILSLQWTSAWYFI